MLTSDWQEIVVIMAVVCAGAVVIRWLMNGGKC